MCMLLSFSNCAENQKVKTVDELLSLRGTDVRDVERMLGEPASKDSTSSEHILWTYYEVMVRSKVDAKPGQRVLLIYLKKVGDEIIVDDVRMQ